MSVRNLRKYLSLLVLSLVATQSSSTAQTTLHARLEGRTYIDDKIQVTAPSGWTIESSNGAVLHNGRFILSLCTGCGQASGIAGGRFDEIAALVQPWARKEEPFDPCGKQSAGGRAGKLDRQDLYYTHPAKDAPPAESQSEWCVTPTTHKTLWYGSFFTLPCKTGESQVDDCGGYFLDHSRLVEKPPPNPVVDEMAFGLSYQTNGVNTLPEKSDPHLTEILRETNAIVASIVYR
jgi:hypothetical protein